MLLAVIHVHSQGTLQMVASIPAAADAWQRLALPLRPACRRCRAHGGEPSDTASGCSNPDGCAVFMKGRSVQKNGIGQGRPKREGTNSFVADA